ncbi:RIP metalloprotease RseP [Staphylococcus pseudoxylosus]|uniref:RIP metalloprotease RseP n=1 Tax=Staphylococcus pseudoxylosus TaxID=2282419 RepID=UPI00299005B1|nr:RIP metalloprotease RseP [Staphylococcus pseudoxylosus]MDW8798991.1 RIP metalloprotease RseP [Staphylococcus pseudoxylosus]MEB6035625.1 RIP metalloprotease RseP [Staphylococcus pseudoxylosus]MEB6044909.1 RIP metalloprotease RseP [Staphylococcus pseudoxylosus]MEB7763301.1 RIP metalloprotease RseP [Staphylococcus pseudoxylosus]MEB8007788.1 RIP metalloprotease RseP [Staphylococcus pseudoxylosus]
MSFLVTIISFIIVFGVLVTVHEYGHMFFAKRAGIMCPEFAIGMGPKIFSFRKNETLYTIRLLPVGGYVRMAGDGLEEPPVQPGMHVKIKLNDKEEITHIILDEQHKFQQIEAMEVKQCDFKDGLFVEGVTAYDDERHRFPIAKKSYFVENGSLIQIAPRDRQFTYKKPYQKFLTLFAGPLFNFLLTLVLFIGLAYYQGTPTNSVDEVAKGTPAAQAGLKSGDTIVKLDGKTIEDKSDIDKVVEQNKDKNTKMTVERDGKTHTMDIKPKKVEQKVTKNKSQTRYLFGYTPATEHTLFKPIVSGIDRTLEAGKLIFSAIVGMIASIFTGNFSFDMLNGPVGIYHSVDSVVKTGIINLISWTALLSVNLGLMNLLPVPALDGGRILFVIYEAIFRKTVNKKAETTIIAIGAVFVLIVMVLVTWNDIQRYFL